MKISYKALLPLLLFILVLSGCGTIRLDANSKTFQIVPERVPNLKSGQTVRLDNYYTRPEIVRLTAHIDADLMQYTQTAIKLLEQGLSHQAINVDPRGSKSIKLRVDNLYYVVGFWSIQVDMKITAILGNGKSFTVSHHNSSPATGYRAVSGAITRSIEKILKHVEFLKYMDA